MANTGDSYKAKLREAHLGWGTYRETDSRAKREGEAYIQIPAKYARKYSLQNSNGTDGKDVFGVNLFRCKSADGLFSGVLRAQGASKADSVIAKQFSADKDLRALGDWYRQIGAQVGDTIKVTWDSDTDITIEIIRT